MQGIDSGTLIVSKIRESLLNNDQLIDLLGGRKVYDQTAPQGKEMPYIILGDVSMSGDDSRGSVAYVSNIDIHVWSNEENRMEVGRIQEQIRRSLHTDKVIGDGVNGIHQVLSIVQIDPDGITRHGVQQYTVFYQEKLDCCSGNEIGEEL